MAEITNTEDGGVRIDLSRAEADQIARVLHHAAEILSGNSFSRISEDGNPQEVSFAEGTRGQRALGTAEDLAEAIGEALPERVEE